jgi:tRNA (cmo5U34)-methyltransferase
MAEIEWDPDRYLDSMLAEIPDYRRLQDEAAAATAGLRVERVLELGTGTGESAKRVLAVHPHASWTGIDASAAMLRRAREALPEAELLHARLEEPLPAGSFDLVVSVLAVHHLSAEAKRDLFRRVAHALRVGGGFVLADVVVPDDPADQRIPIDGVVDLPDRLDDQLAWLRAAGFDAEPTWTRLDLAVVRAVRRP